jgi:four helix bundle protein
MYRGSSHEPKLWVFGEQKTDDRGRMEEERRRTVVSFEDLEVFQRAYRLSLDVHRASLQWPLIEQHALGDQMRRASKSICANVAEGYGRQKRSKAEFKRFLQMAIGSSDEMRVWVRYALDLGYVDHPTWQGWRDEYQVISKMLQVLWHRS